MTEEVLALAEQVWDYHHMGHTLEKADCILALGSHDTRVAEKAAELWLQGLAPLLVFSGGLGRLTDGMWTEPEADKFAAIARAMGVPASAMLVENTSTNTGENILLTGKLLSAHGLNPQTFIVVQKPYMERRSYATFKKHWPDKKLVVTSPQITFKEYATAEIPLERVIHIMVGDLQRIKLYGEIGYQIPQHVPGAIWQAYERLVALGYNSQLIKENA